MIPSAATEHLERLEASTPPDVAPMRAPANSLRPASNARCLTLAGMFAALLATAALAEDPAAGEDRPPGGAPARPGEPAGVEQGAESPVSNAPRPATASESLTIVRHREAGVETETSGRILVTAADGGLLLETQDGRLATITPENLLARSDSVDRFGYWSATELTAALQREFGPEFTVLTLRRYVIVTNGNRAYAQWCGKLLERLQTAFYASWKRDRLELAPPPMPLVAVIFATPTEYAAYATADAGAALATSQGYYSVRTNRIILTDLSRDGGIAVRTEGEIQRRLEARVVNLVTVVHEATHQIAFNSGLQTRYADNPMWVSEGLAMYCEAPDLRSASGWGTIGRLHPGRLQQFQDYVRARRVPGSLATLLADEARFRDPAALADAYAESWALTWFLLRERRPQFVAYLQALSAKPRLVWDPPSQRLADFEAAFGDLAALEAEFVKFTARLRASGAP